MILESRGPQEKVNERKEGNWLAASVLKLALVTGSGMSVGPRRSWVGSAQRDEAQHDAAGPIAAAVCARGRDACQGKAQRRGESASRRTCKGGFEGSDREP